VSLPHFAHPEWFWLLLALPPLLWWWLRQRVPVVRFPDTAWLRRLPGARRGRWVRRLTLGMRCLSLALLVTALAGPRWPDPGSRLSTDGVAIVILVDVSGSMAERDYDWHGQTISRLDAVKKVFRIFVEGGELPNGRRLEGRRSDQIALVPFATRPELGCPLTLNHAVLLKMLDEEKPRDSSADGLTNIGDALAWGLHRLKPAAGRKQVVVLLTDGEQTVYDNVLKPRQAAQLAGNLGADVRIYAIDAGSDRPTTEGLEPASAADRITAKKTLQDVAKLSKKGGKYFAASDTAALAEACAEIDDLERAPIPSFEYRLYDEGYPWFGLAALSLWVLLLVLERTVWRRVP
jgi:Ca-activated chloride channel family protein